MAIAPPSKTYIGRWQTHMLDKAGAGENQPTTIHYVITSMGF